MRTRNVSSRPRQLDQQEKTLEFEANGTQPWNSLISAASNCSEEETPHPADLNNRKRRRTRVEEETYDSTPQRRLEATSLSAPSTTIHSDEYPSQQISNSKESQRIKIRNPFHQSSAPAKMPTIVGSPSKATTTTREPRISSPTRLLMQEYTHSSPISPQVNRNIYNNLGKGIGLGIPLSVRSGFPPRSNQQPNFQPPNAPPPPPQKSSYSGRFEDNADMERQRLEMWEEMNRADQRDFKPVITNSHPSYANMNSAPYDNRQRPVYDDYEDVGPNGVDHLTQHYQDRNSHFPPDQGSVQRDYPPFVRNGPPKQNYMQQNFSPPTYPPTPHFEKYPPFIPPPHHNQPILVQPPMNQLHSDILSDLNQVIESGLSLSQNWLDSFSNLMASAFDFKTESGVPISIPRKALERKDRDRKPKKRVFDRRRNKVGSFKFVYETGEEKHEKMETSRLRKESKIRDRKVSLSNGMGSISLNEQLGQALIPIKRKANSWQREE